MVSIKILTRSNIVDSANLTLISDVHTHLFQHTQPLLKYDIYVSVLAPSCQNVNSSMPDLSARLSSFNMNLNDRLISDHLLEEGWYRTDDHHIPTIGNGATINSCGTFYPIVVKGKSRHKNN